MISKKLFSLHRNLNLSKFLQMRLNSWIIRFLPFFMSRYYLMILGKLYYCFKRKERDLINKTITHVLGSTMKPGQLRRARRQTFKGIFDHYHEKLYLAYTPVERIQKVFCQKNAVRG